MIWGGGGGGGWQRNQFRAQDTPLVPPHIRGSTHTRGLDSQCWQPRPQHNQTSWGPENPLTPGFPEWVGRADQGGGAPGLTLGAAHLRAIPLGVFVDLCHGHVGVELILVFLQGKTGRELERDGGSMV